MINKPKNCIFIGLTGGIASGKSTIGSMFEEKGAVCIHADRLAQEEMDKKEVRDEIVSLFGQNILNEMGFIKRSHLAAVVFGDAEKLSALEKILHPRVQNKTLAIIQNTPRYNNRPSLFFLDIPLLEKSPFEAWCDYRIHVNADENTRSTRCLNTRGWPKDELAKREHKQKSIAAKIDESDFQINNNGSLIETKIQVSQIWQRLTENNTSTMETMHDQTDQR